MVDNNSNIQTDSFKGYNNLNYFFISHKQVNHSKEFVHYNKLGQKITTNTVEGIHGVMRRKIKKMNLLHGKNNNKETKDDKLQEIQWRINHGNDKKTRMYNFMKMLCKVYNPNL